MAHMTLAQAAADALATARAEHERQRREAEERASAERQERILEAFERSRAVLNDRFGRFEWALVDAAHRVDRDGTGTVFVAPKDEPDLVLAVWWRGSPDDPFVRLATWNNGWNNSGAGSLRDLRELGDALDHQAATDRT